MADPTPAEAELAVRRLLELSPDMRGCALLGAGGALAATGEAAGWGEAGGALLDAADRAAGEPADSAHVATSDGEAFAVRCDGLALVAVTDRLALASLVVYDMRQILRDLARGSEAASRPGTASGEGEPGEGR